MLIFQFPFTKINIYETEIEIKFHCLNEFHFIFSYLRLIIGAEFVTSNVIANKAPV